LWIAGDAAQHAASLPESQLRIGPSPSDHEAGKPNLVAQFLLCCKTLHNNEDTGAIARQWENTNAELQ
jgi:hypothetical protein